MLRYSIPNLPSHVRTYSRSVSSFRILLASSLAACLRSVGFGMPLVHHVVPLLDVDGVVEALTDQS